MVARALGDAQVVVCTHRNARPDRFSIYVSLEAILAPTDSCQLHRAVKDLGTSTQAVRHPSLCQIEPNMSSDVVNLLRRTLDPASARSGRFL